MKRKAVDEEDVSENNKSEEAHKRRKMTKDLEELKVWMEAKLDQKLDEKMANVATKDQTQNIMNGIALNSERSKRNEKEIANLHGAIARIEEGQREKFASIQGPSTSYASAASSLTNVDFPPARRMMPTVLSKSENDRQAFLSSRKRLRLWPIEGESEQEIMQAVVVFCCQALGAPRKDQLGIVSAKRVKSAPRGTAYMEVVVEFEDSNSRDYILMKGPMLSMYRDEKKQTNRRYTAGYTCSPYGIF